MANANKNLALAAEHLDPSEEVLTYVFGAYETKVMGGDSVRNGIMAATDRRVFFYAKKLGGYDFEVFPYANISSVEGGKNLMGAHVALFASGNKAKMKWIREGDAQAFVATVRERMGHRPSVTEAASPSAPVTKSDTAERLKKLDVLLAGGLITQEERDTRRAEILAEI